MIYVIIAITLFFLIFNFILSEQDYMNPTVIWGLTFLFAEFICVLGEERFAIAFHEETMIVLLLFFIGISLGNLIARCVIPIPKRTLLDRTGSKRHEIHISTLFVVATIVIQAIAVLGFVEYLNRIYIAYIGIVNDVKQGIIAYSLPEYHKISGSLSELIQLHNLMSNFWVDFYNKLGVQIPISYRICQPVGDACAYILIYIAVNNYVVKRKIDVFYLISFALLCFEILLNGARTPFLILFFMIFALVYIMNYQVGKIGLGNIKGLVKLILFVFLIVILSVVGLRFIGRSQERDLFYYFFCYSGAPLVNFDNNYAKFANATSDVWGVHTFGSIYRYAAKLLRIGIPSLGTQAAEFAYSNNGYEIGNTYTMFRPMIEDFGLTGVAILSFLMSLVLCWLHRRALSAQTGSISFITFIYSYLYGSIVLSFFSEKFYSTLTDPGFLKLLLLSFFIYLVLRKKKKYQLVWNCKGNMPGNNCIAR